MTFFQKCLLLQENIFVISRIVNSLRLPRDYRECFYHVSQVWQLEAPTDGLHILLTFETFELEDPSSIRGSCYDYVEISYDSYNRRYCGSSIPEPITSTGSSMKVKFHTDASHAFTGFRATWSVVKEKSTALISGGVENTTYLLFDIYIDLDIY